MILERTARPAQTRHARLRSLLTLCSCFFLSIICPLLLQPLCHAYKRFDNPPNPPFLQPLNFPPRPPREIERETGQTDTSFAPADHQTVFSGDFPRESDNPARCER